MTGIPIYSLIDLQTCYPNPAYHNNVSCYYKKRPSCLELLRVCSRQIFCCLRMRCAVTALYYFKNTGIYIAATLCAGDLNSHRGLGLQGPGLNDARLQGSRLKISGFQGSIMFHLGLQVSLRSNIQDSGYRNHRGSGLHNKVGGTRSRSVDAVEAPLCPMQIFLRRFTQRLSPF